MQKCHFLQCSFGQQLKNQENDPYYTSQYSIMYGAGVNCIVTDPAPKDGSLFGLAKGGNSWKVANIQG